MRLEVKQKKGFNLVELLVVLVVVSILVGVGSFAYQSACRWDTRMTQELVMNAVQKYYDTHHDPVTNKRAYPALDKFDRHSLTRTSNTNMLVQDLYNHHPTQNMLQDLPGNCLQFVIDNTGYAVSGKILDGWGKEMRYTSSGFNYPALISAGPDGVFGKLVRNEDGETIEGDTDDKSDSNDNMRSDV